MYCTVYLLACLWRSFKEFQNTVSLRCTVIDSCVFCAVHDSAKVVDSNEITPQSNLVRVHDNGNVSWEPRYEFGVTQCHVDVTWFPFDKQTCELVFESWILQESQIVLTTDENATDGYALSSYLETDTMWDLKRT